MRNYLITEENPPGGVKLNLESVLWRMETLGRNTLSYREQSRDILKGVYETSFQDGSFL